MVNPISGVGLDPHLIRDQAEKGALTPTHDTSRRGRDSGGGRLDGMANKDMIADGAADTSQMCPIAHSSGSNVRTRRFLTKDNPTGRLTSPWREVLDGVNSTLSSVVRLWVVADGGCAGGSCVLGLADGGRGGMTMEQARLSDTVSRFRTRTLKDMVQGWTPQEWCEMVPESLRDDMWADRRPCTVCTERHRSTGSVLCTCRSPQAERDFFLQLCDMPKYAVDPYFFHIAAVAMKVGVLLLVDDARIKNHESRQVWDFGVDHYEQSMVIFALYPCSSAADHYASIGHYETVAIPLSQAQSSVEGTPLALVEAGYQTLFKRRHPLLTALVDYALWKSDEKTVATEIVTYCSYPATHPSTGQAESIVPRTPPPPLSPPSAHAAGDSVRRRRLGRKSVLPSRYRDDSEVVAVKSTTPVACRSLTTALDTAAAISDPSFIPDSQPLQAPARTSSSPRGRGWRRTGPQMASTPPTEVEGMPPLPASNRLSTIGAQMQSNVREWVHRTARHGQLARRVHFSSIPLWMARCREVLASLTAALLCQPMDGRTVAANLTVFWMLPGEVFTVPARTGGGKARKKRLLKCLQNKLSEVGLADRLLSRVMEGVVDAVSDGEDVLASLNTAIASSVTESSKNDEASGSVCGGDKSADSMDKQAVQRAERMYRQGDAGRAMMALTSTTGMADLAERDERDKLRLLHPASSDLMPQCPAGAAAVHVHREWIAAQMRASDTGASPGPSGYGSNFLSVLAEDQQCVTAIALLIEQIVNNRLPAAARTLLTTCTVISLEKGDDGRRPLAIGDIFYRMASRYVVALVSKDAQVLMAPHQYGAGQPDGCTQVVHSLQHLLTVPSPRPLACLSVDVANAFNTIDRAQMLRVLYSHPSLAQCWKMVEFGYGQPSLLLMQCQDDVSTEEAFIESQVGVRQGDPLASLLFCLTMHQVYDAVAKGMSGGCYAYVDDSNFVGTVEECGRAWDLLHPRLKALGLTINSSKCELTCFRMDDLHDERDIAALSRLQNAQVKMNDKTVVVLGCVVGCDDDAIATELGTHPRLRHDQLVALRRVLLMKKQTGMSALQRLTGTVLTNRLRAMSPASTERHVAEYDAGVLACAHSVIGITAVHGEQYDWQLQSSLSHGGFGLASAVTIAPAAYLAGAENTLRWSPVFAAVWRHDLQLPATSAMAVAIDDSIQRLNVMETSITANCTCPTIEQVSPSILPSSATTYVRHFQALPLCEIQSAITHRIAILNLIARVARAGQSPVNGVAEVARMRALRERESSLWLRTVPTEPGLTLSDTKWAWAAWLRLGMPVPVNAADCAGCKTGDAHTTDSWHALSCVPLSGRTMTDRHNQVLAVIARYCRMMIVNVRQEPAGLSQDSKNKKKRPDIQVDLPDRSVLGDVTIIHPVVKSWKRKVARRGVEAVGDKAAARKDNGYAEMARAVDMEFHPIVFYTYGGFHRSALKFVSTLVDSFDPAVSLMSRATYKLELKQHIAIAVQRGNADVMIRHSQATRKGWFTSFPEHHQLARRSLPVRVSETDEVVSDSPHTASPASPAVSFFPSPNSPAAPSGVEMAFSSLSLTPSSSVPMEVEVSSGGESNGAVLAVVLRTNEKQ